MYKRPKNGGSYACLQHFFGFVERRTHFRIPAEWEIDTLIIAVDGDDLFQELRKYRSLLRSLTRDANGLVHFDYSERFTKRSGYYLSEGTHMKIEGSTVELSKNDSHICIPLSAFESLSVPFRQFVRVEIGSGKGYFALFERTGGPFYVVCLDLKSSKEIWRSATWAAGTDNLAGLSGWWSHSLAIRIGMGQVACFGSNHAGSYLEAFDEATGKVLYRYCTSYWYQAYGDVFSPRPMP
jgi:hypothetical protein